MKENKPTKPTKLLKIGADWCQSCKVLDKTLAAVVLSIELQTKNLDDMTPQELKELGIKGVPAMFLLDENDLILDRKIGNVPKANLCEWLAGYGVEAK